MSKGHHAKAVINFGIYSEYTVGASACTHMVAWSCMCLHVCMSACVWPTHVFVQEMADSE